MHLFTFIGIMLISMAVATAIISFVMVRLSQAVEVNNALIEREKGKYKPNVTMGHQIAVAGEQRERLTTAVNSAAKLAASRPRGGNVAIGTSDAPKIQTASKNLQADPISAFKIAEHQGWSGLGKFNELEAKVAATPAAPASAGPAATKQVKRKLTPGTDYAVTAIPAGVDPMEKRRIRIANAKAKAAAYKALKESGQDMMTVTTSTAAPAAAVKAPSSADQAAAAGIEAPKLIEITPNMSPDEIRKARIANSKAESAYKKALKAAGIAPGGDSAPASEEAVAEVAPVAAAPSAPAAVADDGGLPGGIPKPDLVKITEGMGANEIRQARIANSKAISAYKKALKAAGIDPTTVKIDEG